MRYITHNDNEINCDGSSLEGNISADYGLLCNLFGQPHGSDGYKSDAGWDIEFEDGTVVTIYNWKNGKNYLGSDGYDTQKITSWNIGGKERRSTDLVKRIVEVEGERIAAAQGHWSEYRHFCEEEVGHTWNPNN